MLDFGTDMTPAGEAEENDDLFGAVSPQSSVAAEPVRKVETVPEKTAAEPVVEEKRPVSPVRPPVLPKYKAKVEEIEVPKVQPALQNNPHFLHRKRKAEEFSAEEKQAVSRILKAARNAAGLTLEDVENTTLIRIHYLVALEEADYDNLPRPVFVLAYLRKLCRLYNIPEEEEMQLVRPWRNIPCELPENLPNTVQKDPEVPNQKVLHQLEIALLAFGALIVLGIVVLIVVWAVSFFSGKDVPELTFENTRLLELQEKPVLRIPEND